jgi:broad specificity phosphatase PhoE
MTVLALLRHGATEWNAAGRLQGRSDIPLSAAGRAALSARQPPAELAGFTWLTSPLRRAVDTAAALGIADARPEPRLIEMDWGLWEGRTLAALRRLPNGAMARAEAAGLDFRPAGGESPREVQARVRPLLVEIAAAGRPVAAVTHKGVIRAIFALAVRWDMHGRAPLRLDWQAVHLFRLDGAGRAATLRLNLPLRARQGAAT